MLYGRGESALQKLLDACGGHPFYLIALARHNNNEGPQAAGASTEVPLAIKVSIQQRMSELSPSAQTVVQILSVAHAGFHTDGLVAATGLGLAAIVEAVASLQVSRLIKDSELTITHDIIKQTIYTDMPLLVRQLRHRQIFWTLTDEDSSNIKAIHAHKGAMPEHAHSCAEMAAARAERLFAFTDAIFFRKMAVDNAPSIDKPRALERLIALLCDLKRYTEASEYVKELENTSTFSEDLRVRILCEIARIGSLLMTQTAPANQLWNQLQQVIADVERSDDQVLLSHVAILALRCYLHVNDRDSIWTTINRLIELTRRAPAESRAELLATFATAMSYNDAARAQELANQALTIATPLKNPRLIVKCLCARASVGTIIGDLDNALADFALAERMALDEGAVEALAGMYINRSSIYFGRGDFSKGHEENRKALIHGSSDILVPIMNEASGYLNADDYVNAIAWANRALEENKILMAPWVALAARAIKGLAQLAIGNEIDAELTYAEIQALPFSNEKHIADPSYSVIFSAQMESRHGRELQACQLLRDQLESPRFISPFGQCRLELALAEALISTDPDRAFRHARNTERRAEQLSSIHIKKRAASVLSLMKDRGL
jgi:tetratricopeptide (TPR) repeat protein